MTLFTLAYRMRVYAPRSIDPTELTVLTPAAGAPHSDPFQVATLSTVAGYKPYLEPPVGRTGRLSLFTRQLDIGEITVRLMDARTTAGGSNLSRWWSAFLGDTKGRPWYVGLRVEMDKSTDGGATWTRWYTGRITRPALQTRVWIGISIREMTDDLKGLIFTGQFSSSLGEAAPMASVAALAGSGAGNVDNGTHSYKVSLVTINGESKPGTASNSVNVTDKTTNGKINLTVVPLGSSDCIRRRIYRTKAGGSIYYFLAEITDNVTTTYQDNTADSALGRLAPIANRSQYAFRPSIYPLGTMKMYGDVKPAPSLQGTVKIVGGGSGKQISIQINDDQLGRPDISVLSPYLANLIRRLSNSVDPNSPSDYPDILRVHVVNQQAGANYGVEGDFKTTTLTTGQRLPLGDADISLMFQLLNCDELVGTEPEFIPVTGFTVNDQVTLDFYSIELPTKENPILINDVSPVRLKRDIALGYFGWSYQPGETLPPSGAIGDPKTPFPIDASTFATMISDTTIRRFRGKIEGREQRIGFIETHIDLAYGLASRVNASGQLVPLDLRLPNVVPSVPTITTDDLIDPDVPGWDYSREAMVSTIEATHYIDRELGPSEYRLSKDPPAALLFSSDVITAVADFGDFDINDRTLKLNLIGYRTQPTEVVNGRSGLEAMRLFVREMMQDLRLPTSRGTITIKLRCFQNSNTDAQVGDWRKLQIDELPDPSTNVRGGLRLARVVERTDDPDGDSRILTLQDSGEALVSSVPAIGTPTTETGNTKHGIQVPVTLNASSDPVVVEVALLAGGSPPAESSPLWMFAGRVTSTSSLNVRNLGSGKTYWARIRSEPSVGQRLKLPSAWVVSTSVTTVSMTAPSAPSVVVNSDLSATLSWTIGETDEQVVLYLASPSGGTLIRLLVLLAGTKRYNLNGLQSATSYRFEVGHVDVFGTETSRVGANFTSTGTVAVPGAPRVEILEGEL